VVVGEGLAVVRRVLDSCADLAVWEARLLVAKPQVCRMGRRVMDDAERRAAEAEVAGLMTAVWCRRYSLGKVRPRQ
jgi:hypothetical protein